MPSYRLTTQALVSALVKDRRPGGVDVFDLLSAAGIGETPCRAAEIPSTVSRRRDDADDEPQNA